MTSVAHIDEIFLGACVLETSAMLLVSLQRYKIQGTSLNLQ